MKTPRNNPQKMKIWKISFANLLKISKIIESLKIWQNLEQSYKSQKSFNPHRSNVKILAPLKSFKSLENLSKSQKRSQKSETSKSRTLFFQLFAPENIPLLGIPRRYTIWLAPVM